MTGSTGASTADPSAPRTPDLVLARVHLRLGALALARAELETLAGRDALDHEGLVDLAEVRWRTGDVVGGGEAAAAALQYGDQPLLALVVAAEAAMDRGRPSEARRYAQQALAVGSETVEPIFAGMPRANVWPVDPMTPPPVAPTLFDDPRGLPLASTTPAGAATASDGAPLIDGGSAATPDFDPPTIGLWDATDQGAPAPSPLPAPEEALELGRAALQDGRRHEAAVAFGLVVRLAPALAPAVVAALAHDRSAELALTRGDALRLVGRETEALRAFAEAIATGGHAPTPRLGAAPATARSGSSHDRARPGSRTGSTRT